MTLPNLPPLKPTGGKIMVSLAIGFAAAGACTQFLSLNMPFGGKLPHTMTNKDWYPETARKMRTGWDREGAPDRPIELNPMSKNA
ncbi:uncharacterized protein MICPUCDRAFT_53720 [Micromonas pusilla CCMP1545]|uniref:Predicted protein n=1 Tax=Micromonas pusilla (strain CCMP1545) TaxID=564608 RepID=C1N7J6_MICPC|nr:uncharacterized protein MICPUCDRAFT_53720 [Micromonas pusilla CCMP1545]EEH52286.1 predicted protein [Micromonas pusilla CCMP1545]|eukprot:XP_003063913.1 predicted protein [Micromonas pusilla CCMP1545]